MRERGKDNNTSYMCTLSLDSVGVCTENTTHEEVLVGVAVERHEVH